MTQDQLDMDLMAEAELARLQRQYRIMEGDRKAFYDETTTTLSKQRKEIERLRRTKKDLLDDIKVATCDAQKRKDLKSVKKFDKLLDRYNDVVERFVVEKSKLDEIEQQIKKTEKEVSTLRRKEVTDEEYKFRIKSGQKTIVMLENKLETTVKRFCSILTVNKLLRHEIDHLLKERTRFNAIWEQLVTDLNNGKKLMLDLIEHATLAYDQREEWCSKMQALKIRAHNDIIVHTQEMREMQRELDHDGNLREFLTIKGQKRVMKDLEEKEMKKRDEEKLKFERQVKIYEETLNEIKKICNDENDIEKISSIYVKQEEENFALFNYVNELSHELELLNESIDVLETTIEEQEEVNMEKAQTQRETLDSLKENMKKSQENALRDEDNLKETQNELKEILAGIDDVFKLTGCDFTPILGLLGDSSAINEDNVMIYLGLIQKKVSTLIADIYFREKSLLKSKRYAKDLTPSPKS